MVSFELKPASDFEHNECFDSDHKKETRLAEAASRRLAFVKGQRSSVCNACYACMTEVTVSARIPQELEKEVERLMREEHLEKSAALRKLLHLGVRNYRLERALRGLAEGQFSLTKAAEEAGLTVWDILDEAARRHVTWVAEDAMDDIRPRKGR